MSNDFRDYYAALGVSKTATAAEIQRAYRTLARKYHPDVNKSPEAMAKFSAAAEAYEVLKDADRRARYDELGVDIKSGRHGDTAHHGGPNGDHRAGAKGRKGRATAGSARASSGRAGGMGPGVDPSHFGGPGFSDFFNSFFGGGAGGDGFGASTGGRGAVQTPSELEIAVPLAVAVLGGQHAVELAYPNGTTRSITIKVPKGSVSGDVLRLAGQGQGGADLLLRLRIAPDARFTTDGRDLVGKLIISPALAAVGGKASVELLDRSQITVTVPPMSMTGRKLRLRGKGVPGRVAGQAAGDLILEVTLAIPEPMTDEALALYKSLLQLETPMRP